MKNKKFIMVPIVIFALLLISSCTPKPAVCTGEAMICPDGSAVARTGPNCEFAKCPQTIETQISTENGHLVLKYENEAASLVGSLGRSTPCVNWTVEVAQTKDLPSSQVSINIFNSNKDAMCIQVLGEPQAINTKINSVSEKTNYVIKMEDKTIFEGRIGDRNEQ